MWPFSRRPAAPAPEPRQRDPLAIAEMSPKETRDLIERAAKALSVQPFEKYAADDGSGGAVGFKALQSEIPDALLGWYASQRFIGYQTCALIAQHWLVDKACSMPARDAVRHGFELQVYGTDNQEFGDQELADIDERLKRADRRHKLTHNMTEFVRMGRVFGVRVAFFKIKDKGPEFYENPFNLDAVGAGEYEGIVQVDPYWCVPMLSVESASDPASEHFYEPEWWTIRGRRYHRSHLIIFRNGDVPDILKPMYNYGGISTCQRIYERVYAAERTANEAPQLAMTKRLITQKTDLTAFMADPDRAARALQLWAYYRDNYGIRIIDTDDEVTQQDTGLADLDAVIMTQYQIVAAAAGVPGVKLMGTTPKGFNSSGSYEEDSYHEELETIQAHDLTPFANRHHALVLRSDVEPALGMAPGSLRVELDWAPVDSPSAKEYAEINKLDADTDNVLVQIGAIDAADSRNRLRGNKNSGYTDLAEFEDPLTATGGGVDPLAAMLGTEVTGGQESPQGPPSAEP